MQYKLHIERRFAIRPGIGTWQHVHVCLCGITVHRCLTRRIRIILILCMMSIPTRILHCLSACFPCLREMEGEVERMTSVKTKRERDTDLHTDKQTEKLR